MNASISGRLYLHPQRVGWVAAKYPTGRSAGVSVGFDLTGRQQTLLLRLVARTAANYGYWTRESLV